MLSISLSSMPGFASSITMSFSQCTLSEQWLLQTACEIQFGSFIGIDIVAGRIASLRIKVVQDVRVDKLPARPPRPLRGDVQLGKEQLYLIQTIRGCSAGAIDKLTVANGQPHKMEYAQFRAVPGVSASLA